MPRLDPAIVEAGRRAFARHGYRGATLERIAEEAGLSRVTLHRRGVRKGAILEALAVRATADYRERMWPILTSTSPAAERLELALGVLCDAAEEHMSLLVALSEQRDATFHEDAEEDALTRGVFTEPLEALLVQGARECSIVAPDPRRSATLLFNLVGWTYIHLRTGHRWTPKRARAEVVGVALRGILA